MKCPETKKLKMPPKVSAFIRLFLQTGCFKAVIHSRSSMDTITHENSEMSGVCEINCCLTAISNYVIDKLNERKLQLRVKKKKKLLLWLLFYFRSWIPYQFHIHTYPIVQLDVFLLTSLKLFTQIYFLSLDFIILPLSTDLMKYSSYGFNFHFFILQLLGSTEGHGSDG